jgi:protein-L-isoaspartate O-methyltransferase
MVEILRRMGIAEGQVLAAIAAVDRADFVPEERRSEGLNT